MVIAAEHPFLDIFWTMLVVFGWVIWLVLLLRVIGDVFRSGMGGFAKAAWIVFVIALPLLGVLIYLIAHGDEMGERDVAESRSDGGRATEIAKAKAVA
jgi:phospholipase D-like protein